MTEILNIFIQYWFLKLQFNLDYKGEDNVTIIDEYV